jgi:hypothetical protein
MEAEAQALGFFLGSRLREIRLWLEKFEFRGKLIFHKY